MYLRSLSLTGFRNIAELSVTFAPSGMTIVTGPNGAGKTSLLEAIGYLATQQSFRGVPREAMINIASEQAILRSLGQVDQRTVEIEAEITRSGSIRTMVNRQRGHRRADLNDALQVTVFSPDDIVVVRGGPAERRRFLDELLVATDPRITSVIDDLDKTIRQRTTLLRRAGGKLNAELTATLGVWDARLDRAGTTVANARTTLTEQLGERITVHHAQLTGTPIPIGLRYRRSWDGRLEDALAAARGGDVAKGVTSVGPHRDDLEISLGGLPARTHASQGEQRTVALAMKLGAHELVTDRLGSAPLLLLDDVFSELDPNRSEALLAGLGNGQAILTTATKPPDQVDATLTVEMIHGVIEDPVDTKQHVGPATDESER